jgi:hypothetical protein
MRYTKKRYHARVDEGQQRESVSDRLRESRHGKRGEGWAQQEGKDHDEKGQMQPMSFRRARSYRWAAVRGLAAAAVKGAAARRQAPRLFARHGRRSTPCSTRALNDAGGTRQAAASRRQCLRRGGASGM